MSAESEKTGELTPIQREGLELYHRIQETEKAYQVACDILSNLDQEENRGKLAEALNCTQAQGSIESSDLEGSVLLSLNRDDLQEEFGASFFPLSVIIPDEKWDGKDGLSKKLDLYNEAEFTSRGSFHSGVGLNQNSEFYKMPYPFNYTGICLFKRDLIQEMGINAHEELHRMYEIYSPFVPGVIKVANKISDPERSRQVYESCILNELSAHREAVRMHHYRWINLESAMDPETVFGILATRYLADIKRYKELYSPSIVEKLVDSCKTMEYIERYLPESAITHILLNCERLKDLTAWLKVTPEEMEELKKTIKNKNKEE